MPTPHVIVTTQTVPPPPNEFTIAGLDQSLFRAITIAIGKQSGSDVGVIPSRQWNDLYDKLEKVCQKEGISLS